MKIHQQAKLAWNYNWNSHLSSQKLQKTIAKLIVWHNWFTPMNWVRWLKAAKLTCTLPPAGTLSARGFFARFSLVDLTCQLSYAYHVTRVPHARAEKSLVPRVPPAMELLHFSPPSFPFYPAKCTRMPDQVITTKYIFALFAFLWWTGCISCVLFWIYLVCLFEALSICKNFIFKKTDQSS